MKRFFPINDIVPQVFLPIGIQRSEGKERKGESIKMAIRNKLKRRILLIGLMLVIFAAAGYLVFGATFDKAPQYKFVTLTKGNLENTISSSGTLSPVTLVEVGTQVSGTINKIYVDFNDQVEKGQVIALLDSALLRMAVTDAKFGLLKAEAQVDEAKSNYDRSQNMREKGLVSEAEFQQVQTSLRTATANMLSAQASLDRALQNLKYAIIRSPIDGTVTARNVEAGQTVAASFSTPTLFTIAQDLSQMEIKALVDESDIGQIKEGQDVRFSVQAHPNKTFTGKVKQIRVQPTTVSNVVNYTVVISVANTENLLLPGMTATVEFIIQRKADILLVANAALRFQPPDKEMAKALDRMQESRKTPPANFKRNSQQPLPGSMQRPGQMPPYNAGERKRLWFLDKEGNLTMAPIQIGISDGTNTEVIPGPFVAEGMQVVSGSVTASKYAGKSTITGQSGPPRMPPPF
jgi:HlyD family secretion protein